MHCSSVLQVSAQGDGQSVHRTNLLPNGENVEQRLQIKTIENKSWTAVRYCPRSKFQEGMQQTSPTT
jgi:hypothetical protein